MTWATTATLAVTILVAVAGYLATYLNNLRLERRKNQLERVNRQLSELYGPLFSLVRVSGTVWDAFTATVAMQPSGKPFWQGIDTATDEELELWRLWIREVFMPLNQRMAEVIIEKADLLDESSMPESLTTLCAHVYGYKAVLEERENGNFARRTSVVGFPSELVLDYTDAAFTRLKKRQAELLGARARVGAWHQGAERVRTTRTR
jgi:hypothetical protein